MKLKTLQTVCLLKWEWLRPTSAKTVSDKRACSVMHETRALVKLAQSVNRYPETTLENQLILSNL